MTFSVLETGLFDLQSLHLKHKVNRVFNMFIEALVKLIFNMITRVRYSVLFSFLETSDSLIFKNDWMLRVKVWIVLL